MGKYKQEFINKVSNLSGGELMIKREKYMKGTGLPCLVSTIIKYIGYLEEAYAIETIKKYSAKSKIGVGAFLSME